MIVAEKQIIHEIGVSHANLSAINADTALIFNILQ